MGTLINAASQIPHTLTSLVLVPVLQILALCFIRKGLDFFFTQAELYWLDHLLPDATLRKKEDEAMDAEEAKTLMTNETKVI